MQRFRGCSVALRGARVLLAVAAAGLLASCMTVGQSFPTQPVSQLEIGKTTRDEVREWFGTPWRTGMENGQRTWTYGRYHYSLFSDAKTRDLVVRFDANGVLASYNFSSTSPGDLAPKR